MIAGYLLAVLLLALGAGAVEMHKLSPSCHTDGSCADDAMLIQFSSKSSAKRQEKLDTAQKLHTAQMLSKLEDLANKVIDGTEKITPATREALETIDDEMDSIISNAEQNKKDFQASVDRTKESVQACGTEATTAHTRDSGVNDLAAAVSSARTAHNTCRASEANLKQDENTKCKNLNDYVGDLEMPSCSCSTAESLGVEGFKNCVAKMKTWSSTAKTTWAEKEAFCNNATSAHAVERTSCNTKQGSLESDFCAYNVALSMACSTQESCRATQKALRETAHASVAVSESAFKAEYQSAKHVKCILKVLNATDEVKRDMLTACISEKVDIEHLNITYHEVPDPTPCDLTPVANKPCDQEWTDAEFQGKTWVTDAPLNHCVSCPAGGGGGGATTATPTDAPYAGTYDVQKGYCTTGYIQKTRITGAICYNDGDTTVTEEWCEEQCSKFSLCKAALHRFYCELYTDSETKVSCPSGFYSNGAGLGHDYQNFKPGLPYRGNGDGMDRHNNQDVQPNCLVKQIASNAMED